MRISTIKRNNSIHLMYKNIMNDLGQLRTVVSKCENELVKATLMYLDDPDAPEGVAFIRWLAVQDYLGEKINWKDLT